MVELCCYLARINVNVNATLEKEPYDSSMSERERTIAQKTSGGGPLQLATLLSISEEPGLLKEKLLLSLVWDKTKFKCDGVIRGEPVVKLILIQVHQTDLTKTTKEGALISKDTQEDFKVFL